MCMYTEQKKKLPICTYTEQNRKVDTYYWSSDNLKMIRMFINADICQWEGCNKEQKTICHQVVMVWNVEGSKSKFT